MAVIPYLDDGDSITAARWNTLWEEFDRKLSSALDDHSLFFWPDILRGQAGAPLGDFGALGMGPFVGKRFYFLANPAAPSYLTTRLFARDPSFAQYNHTPFATGAASDPIYTTTPPIAYWLDLAQNRILLNSSAGFHNSLQAHTRAYAGGGTTAVGTVNLSFGIVSSVTITNQGSGYYTEPTVTIEGDGTGATAEAVLTGDKLTSVRILTRGTGYTTATVRFSGGNDAFTSRAFEIVTTRSTGGMYHDRIRKHQSVELIFDSYGSFDFPANFNKYIFFRVHNIHSASLTLNFKGTTGSTVYSVTVPAWGSKCVRRDTVDSGYALGWNHFHRVHSGDARIYDSGQNDESDASVSAYLFPSIPIDGTRSSNNAFSAHMAYVILRTLHIGPASGATAPRFIFDMRQLWDASALYCEPQAGGSWTRAGTHYGEVKNATPIGDLLFHRGKLAVVTAATGAHTKVDFNGFANLAVDLGAAGVAVSDTASGLQFTASGKDLAPLSCNLLQNVKSISSGHEIFFPALARNEVQPVAGATDVSETNYYGWTLNGTTVTRDSSHSVFQFQFSKLSRNTNLESRKLDYRSNVETVLKLNFIGSPDWQSSDQTTPQSVISDRLLTLTGFGPVLTWTQTTTVSQFPDFTIDPTTYRINDAGGLVRRGWFHVQDANEKTWPEPFPPGGVGYTQAERQVIPHVFPRVEKLFGYRTRRRGDASIWGIFRSAPPDPFESLREVDFTNDNPYESQLDVAQPVGSNTYKKTGIAISGPFDRENTFHSLAQWANGDLAESFYVSNRSRFLDESAFDGTPLPIVGGYYSDRYDRLPLLVEYYNNIASLINAVSHVVRLDFLSVFTEAASNSIGLYGSTIRPWNQHARVTTSAQTTFWQGLGVPIKSFSDFPASWATLQAATYRSAVVSNNELVISDGGPLLNSAWQQNLFGAAGSDPTYSWVTIASVKAKATELGLKFVSRRITVPLKLVINDGSPSLIISDSDQITFGQGPSVPLRFPAFVPADLSDVEFCQDPTDGVPLKIAPSYDPATDLLLGGSRRLFRVESAADWRRRNWSGRPFATQPFHAQDRHWNSVMFLNYSPDGYAAKVFRVPAPVIRWAENYDKQSTNHALAVFKFGLAVVPPTLIPASGLVTVESIAAERTILTATRAEYLSFFSDTLLAV